MVEQVRDVVQQNLLNVSNELKDELFVDDECIGKLDPCHELLYHQKTLELDLHYLCQLLNI